MASDARFDAEADESLLAAWRGGDRARGQALYARHCAAVQDQLRNKVPWAEACDLMQETFVAAVRSTGPVRCVRAYLIGIALNLVREHFRREQRKRRRDDNLDSFAVDELYPDPEQWIVCQRERRFLLQAIRKVPLSQQLVLELRYWEGATDALTAEMLGEPLGTVKTWIATGRRSLERELRRLSRSPDDVRTTLDSLEAWAERMQSIIARGQWPSSCATR